MKSIQERNNSQDVENSMSVENTDVETLCKMVCSRICNANALKLLDNILKQFTDLEASRAKRQKLVKDILKTLKTVTVSNNHMDKIINRIVIDFPKYSKEHLIKLVEFCTDEICCSSGEFKSNVSWKDILPTLLEVLEEETYINYMNSDISGAEYKTLIIKSICNSHWSPTILPSLAKMFGDISLGKNESDLVIKALCHKMPKLELNAIPPFVHQALKLGGNQDNRHLFAALHQYFKAQYTNAISEQNKDSFEDICVVNLKELQNTESTVLYHVQQAAQLNQKSTRDYLRYLKSAYTVPEYILDPFMLSVLLLLSNTWDEHVFELLKITINRQILMNQKQKKSVWLKELLPDELDIMIVIEQVIINSTDRHLVLKGLLGLAFVLMGVEQKSKTEENILCHTGCQILQKLIKKRHDTGTTILQMLIDKIIAGGIMIQQYTECLAYMCQKSTMTVLEGQTYLITLLDQLLCIPGEAAEQVLSAILPLIRISSTTRDNVILALRKALYRKGTERRAMAVAGFLGVLSTANMHSQSILSMSQSDSSTMNSQSPFILTQATLERNMQQTGSPSEYNKSLCYDILSILGKCYSQECDVKLRLYRGAYNVTLKNSEISEYILETLVTHFHTYFEMDENVLPPVQLELCSDIQGVTSVLQEPIADLINAIQQIYIKLATEETAISSKVALILKSLCRRMVQLELEHLNIDERINLAENVPKSQQKLQNLRLIVMIYEALLSYRLESWTVNSIDYAQNIISLFKGYKRFVDLRKRINKSKKGDNRGKTEKDTNNITVKNPNRVVAPKLPETVMNFNAVYKGLSLFCLDSVPWSTKEQIVYLKAYEDFLHYLLQTCTQLLQNTRSLTNGELQRHKEQYMKTYIELGRLLYKSVVLQLNDINNLDKQRIHMAMDCFKELCFLLCTRMPSQLCHFMFSLSSEVESNKGLNIQLQEVISKLKSSLKLLVTEEVDDDTCIPKIQLTLLEIINLLVHQINFEEIKDDKVIKWIQEFAYMKNLDSSLAIMILQLLLWVEERSNEYGEILNEIAVQLCATLGTIDDTQLQTDDKFGILHENVILQAYNILNSYLSERLNNAVWLLARLKGEQILISTFSTGDKMQHENLKMKERSLCRQLSYIIQTLYTLANTAIDPGQSSDIMFKNLQQLYNLLTNLTKHFAGKSSAQNPAFEAVKFIQVIQLAGKSLKAAFYNLVTHTEENQNKTTLKSKGDTFAQRNKVLKETRIIPRVVYEIEQFNKEILLLGKKTGIPLDSYVKHSVTRDFRINNTQLTESLEQMDISMLTTQNSHTDETETSNSSIHELDETCSPLSKRAKK